jgi:hypothetical protein
MALTAEKLWSRASHIEPVMNRLPVKDATKIWRGEILGDNGDLGMAKSVIAADATSIGIAEETVDNTAGADSALYVLVILAARIWVPKASLVGATPYDGANDIGQIMYWDPTLNGPTAVSVSMIDLGKIDSYEPGGPSNPAGFWINYKARQVRDV